MSTLPNVTKEQEVLLHLAHLCGQLQLCQENLNRGPDDKNANGAACHLLERVAASYAKLDPYLRGRISNPACLNACVRLLHQVLLFAAWLHPLCLGAVNEAWGLAASLASTLCHILSNPATQQPSTIWGARLRTALQDSPPLLNRPPLGLWVPELVQYLLETKHYADSRGNRTAWLLVDMVGCLQFTWAKANPGKEPLPGWLCRISRSMQQLLTALLCRAPSVHFVQADIMQRALIDAFTGMARISYASMRDGSLQPWSQALQQLPPALPALLQQQEGFDAAAASSMEAAVDQACGSAVLSNTGFWWHCLASICTGVTFCQNQEWHAPLLSRLPTRLRSYCQPLSFPTAWQPWDAVGLPVSLHTRDTSLLAMLLVWGYTRPVQEQAAADLAACKAFQAVQQRPRVRTLLGTACARVHPPQQQQQQQGQDQQQQQEEAATPASGTEAPADTSEADTSEDSGSEQEQPQQAAAPPPAQEAGPLVQQQQGEEEGAPRGLEAAQLQQQQKQQQQEESGAVAPQQDKQQQEGASEALQPDEQQQEGATADGQQASQQQQQEGGATAEGQQVSQQQQQEGGVTTDGPQGGQQQQQKEGGATADGQQGDHQQQQQQQQEAAVSEQPQQAGQQQPVSRLQPAPIPNPNEPKPHPLQQDDDDWVDEAGVKCWASPASRLFWPYLPGTPAALPQLALQPLAAPARAAAAAAGGGGSGVAQGADKAVVTAAAPAKSGQLQRTHKHKRRDRKARQQPPPALPPPQQPLQQQVQVTQQGEGVLRIELEPPPVAPVEKFEERLMVVHQKMLLQLQQVQQPLRPVTLKQLQLLLQAAAVSDSRHCLDVLLSLAVLASMAPGEVKRQFLAEGGGETLLQLLWLRADHLEEEGRQAGMVAGAFPTVATMSGEVFAGPLWWTEPPEYWRLHTNPLQVEDRMGLAILMTFFQPAPAQEAPGAEAPSAAGAAAAAAGSSPPSWQPASPAASAAAAGSSSSSSSSSGLARGGSGQLAGNSKQQARKAKQQQDAQRGKEEAAAQQRMEEALRQLKAAALNGIKVYFGPGHVLPLLALPPDSLQLVPGYAPTPLFWAMLERLVRGAASPLVAETALQAIRASGVAPEGPAPVVPEGHVWLPRHSLIRSLLQLTHGGFPGAPNRQQAAELAGQLLCEALQWGAVGDVGTTPAAGSSSAAGAGAGGEAEAAADAAAGGASSEMDAQGGQRDTLPKQQQDQQRAQGPKQQQQQQEQHSSGGRDQQPQADQQAATTEQQWQQQEGHKQDNQDSSGHAGTCPVAGNQQQQEENSRSERAPTHFQAACAQLAALASLHTTMVIPGVSLAGDRHTRRLVTASSPLYCVHTAVDLFDWVNPSTLYRPWSALEWLGRLEYLSRALGQVGCSSSHHAAAAAGGAGREGVPGAEQAGCSSQSPPPAAAAGMEAGLEPGQAPSQSQQAPGLSWDQPEHVWTALGQQALEAWRAHRPAASAGIRVLGTFSPGGLSGSSCGDNSSCSGEGAGEQGSGSEGSSSWIEAGDDDIGDDGERPHAVEADMSTIQHSDTGDSDAGSDNSQHSTSSSSDDGALAALLAQQPARRLDNDDSGDDGDRPSAAAVAAMAATQHSDAGDSDAGSHSSQWSTSSDGGVIAALLAQQPLRRPDHDVHAALHDLSTKVFDQAQRVLTAPCWLPGCAFPGCGFWDAASQVSLVANARRAVCGGCGVAHYCCWACRRADWGWRHRKVCSSLRRELQEASAAAAAAAAAAAEGAAAQQVPLPAAGSSSSDADADSGSSNSSSAEQVAGVQTGPSNGQQQQLQPQRPAPWVKVWPGMLAFALQQGASELADCV